MIKFANNAVATLAQPISSIATSIPLTTGHGAYFPSVGAPDRMLVTLSNAGTETKWEVCEVVGRAGDTLTVVRGPNPQTFLAGDTVKCRWTSEHAHAAMNAHGVDMDFWLRREVGNVLSVAQTIVNDYGENVTFHFAPNKTYDFGYAPLITSAPGQTFAGAQGGHISVKILGGIERKHRRCSAQNLYLRGPTGRSSPQLYGYRDTFNAAVSPMSDGWPDGTYPYEWNGMSRTRNLVVEGWDIGVAKVGASSWDRFFDVWVQGCYDIGMVIDLEDSTAGQYIDYGDPSFLHCRSHYNPLNILIKRCGGAAFTATKIQKGGVYVDGSPPVSGLLGGMLIRPTVVADDRVYGVYMAGCQFEDNDNNGGKGLIINALNGTEAPTKIELTGCKIDDLLVTRCHDLRMVGGSLHRTTSLASTAKACSFVDVGRFGTVSTPFALTDNTTDSVWITQEADDTHQSATYGNLTIAAKRNLTLSTAGTMTLTDSSGTKTLSQL